MTLTTHAVVGAAIASLIPEHPVLVFGVAFASHFVIDAIPHWDYPIASSSINPKIGAPMKYDKAFFRDLLTIGADALVGIFLSLWLFFSSPYVWVILLGACAGIIPDPLQFLYTRWRHEPLSSLQRFHRWIHTSYRMEGIPLVGVFSQLVFLTFVVVCAKLL